MRGKALGVLLAASAVACGLFALREVSSRHAAPPPAAQYVGATACAGCHQAQASAWSGSQHAAAMQAANAQTVLGNFDGAQFSENGVTSTFFRKNDRYFVRTDGADGKLADFELKYTFGVYPLQQYLVPLAGGRMQALPIAWDARPKGEGGQRWFHIYAGQQVTHQDPLHWTRLNQNWNYMCAECHSTNLQRNYDAATDRYNTTWTDIAVGCESCHGPGSNHLAWAQKKGDDPTKGLRIALDERHGVQWTHDAAGNPARSKLLDSHREVETCAVCHSRRQALGNSPAPTGSLFDTHDPVLLHPDLYFPDGQQQDEVYVHGSFVQSKMYQHGVTCSDCHDPHSGKLRATGNATCTQCHAAPKYDAPAHHLHAANSPGAQCVSCHMPERTYMQVDPRRDHSIRVPRPDLSLQYGTPNACNGCHQDKDAAWAATAIEKAHGPTRKGYQHYADALASARTGAPGAMSKLLALAADGASPNIARATAVSGLAAYPGDKALQAIKGALADQDPMIRAAALDALSSFPPQIRMGFAAPFVQDPVTAVRLKASHAIAGIADEGLTPDQRAIRDTAYDQYRASQQALAERPESHVNLGNIHAERGRAEEAIKEYQTASRLDPLFIPAYVHLADLHRALGEEPQSAAALAEGLKQVPGNATLLYFSGLQRIRAGDSKAALALLRESTAADPREAQYAYAYALALDAVGKLEEATAVVTHALQSSPYSPQLLEAGVQLQRKAGNAGQADEYQRRYAELAGE